MSEIIKISIVAYFRFYTSIRLNDICDADANAVTKSEITLDKNRMCDYYYCRVDWKMSGKRLRNTHTRVLRKSYYQEVYLRSHYVGDFCYLNKCKNVSTENNSKSPSNMYLPRHTRFINASKLVIV